MSAIASTTERSRRSIHQAAASAAEAGGGEAGDPVSGEGDRGGGDGGGKEHRQQNPPGRNRLASLNFHRKINLNESRRPL